MFRLRGIVRACSRGGTRRYSPGPWPRQRLRQRRAGAQITYLLANRDAQYSQIAAIVALHENADGVAALFRRQHSRGGADAAFEAIATHPGAATYGAFFDRARFCAIERLRRMGGFHVFAVGVIEKVEGLGNHWIGEQELAAILQLPLNRRIPDSSDTMGTG